MKKIILWVIVFVLMASAAGYWYWRNQKANALVTAAQLFESVSPDSTGIRFANIVTTNDSINLMKFEYVYIGGGVGVGDFNGDGLQDLFFAGNMVPSKLYLNKGNFQFEDLTSKAGINVKGWPFGVSVADVNGDSLPDIYLSMGAPSNKSVARNELFINQGNDKLGNPSFKEMASEYGLAQPAVTIQSLFFDYDRDGDLDMYELNGGSYDRSPNTAYPIRKDGSAKNTDRLYRNDFDKTLGHPVFTDVSKQANILEEGYGLGVSILDINEDGWPDVYVTDDYLSNDLVYVNNRDGTFTEQAAKYFNHTSHFAMGNDVGDINNDGLMDIMAVDMLPEKRKDRMQMLGVNMYDKFYYAQSQGYLNQYMRNTLQLNQGGGKFSEIGQMSGVYKTSWSWAPLFADFDNDGLLDLFITNGFGKDVTDLDFVKFRSDLSAYTRTSDQREETNEKVGHVLDEQPGIKSHPFLYRNKGDNTFSDMSQVWGFSENVFSNGAAYVDLDNDGDLDIVTNNLDAPAHIYRNKATTKDGTKSNHYLRVSLKGPAGNAFATGSTVRLKTGKTQQIRYLSTVRGFESSVEPVLHFGLGLLEKVDAIEVTWPDGTQTVVKNCKADKVLQIDYQQGNRTKPNVTTSQPAPLFAAVPAASMGIDHMDKHPDFIDFNFERLIPRKYSENGQGIAVADVNGDGREDFFIGGAFQQAGKIYLQDANGHFKGEKISQYADGCLDAGSLFFDADGDGDMDLYVVSGGNQFTKENPKYQDRLYKNDGKGHFSWDKSALPTMLASGSCVVANDYDDDGDPDLFVGGGVKPGFYPQASKSFLLRNEGGRFTDVTAQLAPEFSSLSIVTGAQWTDIDNDGAKELMVVGEWMPITTFKFNGKHLVDVTTETGLANTDGWWQSLVTGDFDNDGDMDYVVGNWGLNTPFRCDAQHPLTICYEDFDKNGTTDPIFCAYEEGKNYPVAPLDYMADQLPVLKKKYLRYVDYAAATATDVMTSLKSTSPPALYCKMLASVFLQNTGNGKFKMHKLPQQSQVAPLFGTLATDVNGDGNLDLVGVGNFYWTDVGIGKYDAGKGLTLLGDGKGGFTPATLLQSGFMVDNDARALAKIQTAKNGSLLLVSTVLDSFKVFKPLSDVNAKPLYPQATEAYAELHKTDGRLSRLEFGNESGYLSQSSTAIALTPCIERIRFYDKNKRLIREVKR